MKILLIAVIFFASLSFSKSTMRVKNYSNLSMEVIYIAYFGCNGIATDIQGDIQTFVCEKELVAPGKNGNYTWGSLDAGRTMKVFSEDKRYLSNTESMDDEEVTISGVAPNYYVGNTDNGTASIHFKYQWPEKRLYLNKEGEVEGHDGSGYIDRDPRHRKRAEIEEGQENDDVYIPDEGPDIYFSNGFSERTRADKLC